MFSPPAASPLWWCPLLLSPFAFRLSSETKKSVALPSSFFLFATSVGDDYGNLSPVVQQRRQALCRAADGHISTAPPPPQQAAGTQVRRHHAPHHAATTEGGRRPFAEHMEANICGAVFLGSSRTLKNDQHHHRVSLLPRMVKTPVDSKFIRIQLLILQPSIFCSRFGSKTRTVMEASYFV